MRTEGKTNEGAIIMGGCSWPPSQDSGTKNLFFEEPKDASKSTALVLMGEFSLRVLIGNMQLVETGPGDS